MSSEKSKSLFSQILLIYLISRLVLEAVGILSIFYFPSARAIFPIKDLLYHEKVSASAEMWARWDSEWYLLIAEQGYDSHSYFKDFGGGRYLPAETTKFFPLYPLCIRLFSFLTGNTVLAGILVSNIAAVLFLYFFYRLTTRLFDSEVAAQSCLLYILFPASFFLNAVYSESLFLACLVACFCYIEEKRLWPAAFALSLTLLCRPTGVLALPAVLWLAAIKFQESRIRSVSILMLAGGGALLLYIGYVVRIFGSYDAIISGVNYWRGQSRYPFYALVRFFNGPMAIHGQHNSIIDFSFAALHILALAVSFRRLPKPYYIYSIITIAFPLSSTLFSFSRLGLANFPLFLYLGTQLTGRWALLVQIVFAMLRAFFMAPFANWYWVG